MKKQAEYIKNWESPAKYQFKECKDSISRFVTSNSLLTCVFWSKYETYNFCTVSVKKVSYKYNLHKHIFYFHSSPMNKTLELLIHFPGYKDDVNEESKHVDFPIN